MRKEAGVFSAKKPSAPFPAWKAGSGGRVPVRQLPIYVERISWRMKTM
jgi:hypothetical protein